jgi:hypothetical protein
MAERFKFDTLNTSYVNLASLIRYFRENNFTGRLHIVLDQYEADVFLYGSATPSVSENDHAAGRESKGEEALQRLLVRAREPGGEISVYEGPIETPAPVPANSELTEHSESVSLGELADESWQTEPDLTQLIEISSEIINAVARAVNTAGVSFSDQFYSARIDIGDDYPMLDPTVGGFDYTGNTVELQGNVNHTAYAQGLTEALKRVVNRVSQTRGGASFRERVAVELAIVSRRLSNKLGPFGTQLNMIAGTRVL